MSRDIVVGDMICGRCMMHPPFVRQLKNGGVQLWVDADIRGADVTVDYWHIQRM